jgi:FtsH-binding integral membrane protein
LIFLLEVVSVAFISKYVENLNLAMVWVTFLFYSAFNGISFALFFLWFPPATVAFGFFITALTFGAMAMYGRYTKCDLGGLKSLGMLVMVGVVLMIAFNLALGHSESFYATTFLGIIFFAGLTASHVQDIRNMEWEFEDDDAACDKAALVSALLIYLDLVNLYMLFSRFVAQSRNTRVGR